MGSGEGWRDWARYEWSCVKRAFEGRRGYAESAAALLVLVLSPLSSFAPIDPIEWGTAMSWLPSALFALIFLGLVAYGIGRSSFDDVRSLQKRVAELEKELQPKLAFEGPFVWTEPKDVLGKANLRTYRLRVKNDSGIQIEDCSVRLIEMVNMEGRRTRHDSTRFKMKGDDPPPNMPTVQQAQSFDINPFDYQDVDVVEYAEEKDDDNIFMCYASRGVSSLNESRVVPRALCPHEMHIRAAAKNSSWVDIKLKFYVDEKGIFRLERV